MVERDGICLICHIDASDATHWNMLTTESRHRKAKWMDAAAVALLMALMMALGVIAWAATANADTDEQVYVSSNANKICDAIDAAPSIGGISAVTQTITDDGWHLVSAVDIVNTSVMAHCPQYWLLLVAAGQIGGEE